MTELMVDDFVADRTRRVSHVRRPLQVWLGSLAVAWGFDYLFWGKRVGLSFPVFVGVAITFGLFLAWREGVRPSWRTLLLVVPVTAFAVATLVRLDPLTAVIDYLMTLVFLVVMARSFTSGQWAEWRTGQWLAAPFRMLLDVSLFPVAAAEVAWQRRRSGGHPRAVPILRGVLIALPVVVLFTLLLGSADRVFGDWVAALFRPFAGQALGEHAFRALYVVVLSYFIAGIYLNGLFGDMAVETVNQAPFEGPQLGATETAIVLGAVDVLFASFVAVQFRYFFGGRANVVAGHYSYADYARRGFGELVVVAAASVVLFLALAALAVRDNRAQRRTFAALSGGLVLLVVVILVSAYQRLVLYEDAFGFSRTRMLVHVFMIWLAVMLIAFLALDLAGRLRFSALAMATVVAGFCVTLNAVNVDGFIAKHNIDRARAGGVLDVTYLEGLSDNAVAAMVAALPSVSGPLQAQLVQVLACKAAWRRGTGGPWPTWNAARSRADTLLTPYRGLTCPDSPPSG